MTITEKAAYLKGLVEGNALDPEFGEGKLWHVLSELVSDMASELAELREDQNSLSDSLEEVEVGLDYLEELLQDGYDEYDSDTDDEDEDEDEDYYPFGSGNFHVVDSDDEEDAEDDDGVFYEVECPNCGEQISFDDETLDEGSIQCPNCGATLEFDMRSGEEEPDPSEENNPEDGNETD